MRRTNSDRRVRLTLPLTLVVAVAAALLSPAAPIAAASDRDGDGLSDAYERRISKTDPRNWDTDGDGLSDGFEVRWGVSSPLARDSDGDGLIDALEDVDGDGLSALGEQRFGTDPGTFDSDGDGIGDGAADANGNGVRDALEQDRTRVPRRLRAVIAAAPTDFVNDQNGCHTGIASDLLYRCVYGNTQGRLDITIFGDSHALQWLPALDRAGKARGWRVTSLSKSACPSAGVTMETTRFRMTSCLRWRKSALAWLKERPQDLVVIANSGRYPLVDGKGNLLHGDAREARWQRGLSSTIKAMPRKTKVVVLADTPRFMSDPHRCLLAPRMFISDCQTRRAAAINERHNEAEREVTDALGAHFADLNGVVCPYDPCPLLAGDMAIWRDKGHLTESYALQLAPTMQKAIRSALKRKRPVSSVPVSSPGLADTTVAVAVHDSFLEPDTIEVASGVELEVIFTNVGNRPHRLEFLAPDGAAPLEDGKVRPVLRRGASTDIILVGLEPGDYTLTSDALPEGMSGKLVVRARPLAVTAATWLAGVLQARSHAADGELHQSP